MGGIITEDERSGEWAGKRHSPGEQLGKRQLERERGEGDRVLGTQDSVRSYSLSLARNDPRTFVSYRPIKHRLACSTPRAEFLSLPCCRPLGPAATHARIMTISCLFGCSARTCGEASRAGLLPWSGRGCSCRACPAPGGPLLPPRIIDWTEDRSTPALILLPLWQSTHT